ncbi:MAG: hypothetical protein VB104_04230 [Candidatus Limiplasma sp.]|nr:hypothetical protein [Candidatus Limiplasma sp.]
MNVNVANLYTAQAVGPIIAVVVALVGAVAAALLFFNAKRHTQYRGLLKRIGAHVNFDRFLLSSILKFLYVFVALYCVAYGLVGLFTGAALAGLLWLVLGPVTARVVFEQLLLLLSLHEQQGETNDLLRRMQGLPPKAALQPQPQPQPQPVPQQPNRSQPADPRYPPRPVAYPQQNTGFNGYTARPNPAPAYPAEYGMTQRYAPIRRESYGGYEPTGYGAAAGAAPGANPPPVVRPTPADGTGRFTALPMQAERDERPSPKKK